MDAQQVKLLSLCRKGWRVTYWYAGACYLRRIGAPVIEARLRLGSDGSLIWLPF